VGATPTEKTYTVSEITAEIRAVLEGHFAGPVAVQGEVSNYKRHTSGHLYFSLKDEDAVLRCVCFRGAADALLFEPSDGMSVVAYGEVTVYPRNGQYQLVVLTVRLTGAGDLFRALEELKRKLAAEGLFDEERKKSLPSYPQRIGVVTSESGAAFRDIANVLSRRWPGITIVIRDTRVQGVGAADDIATAIEEFNLDGTVDLLIVGRGGGSLEDLWAFNEELAVRAVAASAIPVISAVGHEVDWALTDFAADLRAPTPSAAAELAVPRKSEVFEEIEGLTQFYRDSVLQKIYDSRYDYLSAYRSYGMKAVPARVRDLIQDIDSFRARASSSARGLLRESGLHVAKEFARLKALSPKATLERGYTLTVEEDGETLAGKALKREIGERLGVLFEDGRVDVLVEEVAKGGPFAEKD
jgi:exodeoxyribonuclease VII large subunit